MQGPKTITNAILGFLIIVIVKYTPVIVIYQGPCISVISVKAKAQG